MCVLHPKSLLIITLGNFVDITLAIAFPVIVIGEYREGYIRKTQVIFTDLKLWVSVA